MARRRLPDRDGVKLAYLEARQRGLNVRDAAAAAGVHVCTVCRWRRTDPAFDALAREPAGGEPAAVYSNPRPGVPAGGPPTPGRAATLFDLLAALPRPGEFCREKPSVPWHPDCPACGAAAVVRKKIGRRFGPAFWRCSRWPTCKWASWRPRHPDDCPACGGPRFWAHSRKSVACPRCRTRAPAGVR